MDVVGEGGLLLNVTGYGQTNVEKPKSKRITPNRGDRIRERRHKKFLEQKADEATYNEQETVPPKLNNDSPSPEKLTKKRKASEDVSVADKRSKFEAGGHRSHGQIISSLFKNNPEIPVVHSKSVSSLKEAVFSTELFSDLKLHPFLVSNLTEKMGLRKMTSVQEETIPQVLAGRDVLAKSQTGSGKTLSYAVPIVHQLQAMTPKVQRSDGPYAVVLVPTRELAIQSFETFQQLTRSFTWIVPGCIMGGEQRKKEKARLRKGINVLVCTPGRLIDHMGNTESLCLDHVRWLVIDEADRLLDMGYEQDVKKIVSYLDEKQQTTRQTVLLSATLNQGVERLAGMTLRDAIKVDITQRENNGDISVQTDSFAVPEKLRQHFVIVPSKLRLVTLAAFILWKCKFDSKQGKLIIFLSTQDSVDLHYTLFDHTLNAVEDDEEKEEAIEFYRLHGDMEQKERTKTFQQFAQSSKSVLFCTDVAARGLDLPKVQWIIQYTAPGSTADYIHRVGRTARIGSHGNSLLFLLPSEVDYIRTLSDNKISLQELDMQDILKTLLLEAGSLTMSDGKQNPHTVEECATAVQMKLENFIYSHQEVLLSARKAYQSFLRAYATYASEVKQVFHVKHLHLGHMAKSFGLREAPSKVGHYRDLAQRKLEMNKEKMRKKEKVAKKKRANVSEFGSGIEGATKAVFKKDRKLFNMKKKKKGS